MRNLKQNIYCSNSTNSWLESQYEYSFLKAIFSSLQAKNIDFYNSLVFLIHSTNRSNPRQEIPQNLDLRNVILIYLSDDWHYDQEFFMADKFAAVFKCYIPANYKNVYSFPLGYTNGFEDVEAIPFHKKDINVFFSGQLNERRKDFVRQASQPILARLPKRISNKFFPFDNAIDLSSYLEDSFIEFNSQGWGKGLSKNEYINHLRRSKVALCLGGFHVEETFRHYEALKMGCVVVSKKINNPILKDAPFLFVEDWFGIMGKLKRNLKDEGFLEEMSSKSLVFWKERLSPSAMAEYIIINTQIKS